MAQISKELAMSIAKSYLHDDGDTDIVVGFIEETDLGWLFGYNSRRFLETGDMSHALVGGGPILVLKDTGDLYHFGSAYSSEEWLDQINANPSAFQPEDWPGRPKP